MKMKRNIIITLLLFAVLISAACKSVDFTYNKENPEKIVITSEAKIEKVKVVGQNYGKSLGNLDISSNGLKATFDENYFKDAYPGSYEIIVTAGGKEKSYNLEVTGHNVSLPIINKSQIMDADEDKYFVLYTKDSCAPCNSIKDSISSFIDFVNSYNCKSDTAIFAMNSDVNSVASSSSIDYFTSAVGFTTNAQFQKAMPMSTPSLFLIENGVVTISKHGASQVKSYIEAYIEEGLDAGYVSVNEGFTSYDYKVGFTADSVVLSGQGVQVDLSDSVKGKTFTLTSDHVKDLYNGTYQIRFYSTKTSEIQFLYFNVNGSIDYMINVPTTEAAQTYNKENPEKVAISTELNVKKIVINGKNTSTIINNVADYYKDNKVTFNENFFMSYKEAVYSIRLIADDKTETHYVKVTGQASFYLTKLTAFDVDADRYYVLYSSVKCTYCRKVDQVVIDYNEWALATGNTPLYLIEATKEPDNDATNENVVGVKDGKDLQDNYKLSTPNLLVIENGEIVEIHKGATLTTLELYENLVKYYKENKVK